MKWRSGLGVGALVVAALLGACGDDPVGSVTTVPPDPDAGDATDEQSVTTFEAGTDAAPARADFGLDARPSNTTCKVPARPPSAGPLALEQVFSNVSLYYIVAMAQPPGDSSRWFAATLDGKIVSFPAVSPPNTPTLVADIATLSGMPLKMVGEGGLLDLAFHPKFAQNGQLFVSWTASGGASISDMRSVVSKLTSADNGATFTQHEVILGPFDQPALNHNGGCTKFGPDGFLYLSFGDGGGGGDTYLNGQTVNGFFSKILRIDVDNRPVGKTYGIPDGNPFKNGGGEPATFARGFRNPWRFSFDRATGDLWCGDVGEGAREEVDIVKAGGNYGWSCREGTSPYVPARCAPTDALVEPIYDYGHNMANAAISGGVVYRGSAIPELVGTYIFGDSSTNAVYTLVFDPTTGAATRTTIPSLPKGWVSFAEDTAGEVYPVDINGTVWKVVRAQPASASTFPEQLSKTGCVDPLDANKPAPGMVPYDVNSAFWSDGADKQRFLALPDGKTITVGADGDFDLPIGSVLVKTFSLAGKKIETRLFMRHDDGEWAGYTYEWNDQQTDATLLPSSKTKTVGTQTWTFPSRSQCVNCHTAAAGHTLGLELGQLNGDYFYAQTNRISNQLRTLDHIGMLSAPLGPSIDQLVAYPKPTAPGALEPRARSYLHANCSYCHRPTGPGRGDLDLRFGVTLAATKACGTDPTVGSLGVMNAKVVASGSPSTSIVSLRTHALDSIRMPPLGSRVVDVAGVDVLDSWIHSLTACP